MSTRKLILLALACGLAILVAGSIQLLRISREDNRVQVLTEGQTAKLDGAQATVLGSAVDGGKVVVRVTVTSERTSGIDAGEPFTLLAGGKLSNSQEAPGLDVASCRGTTLQAGRPLTCALAFDDREGTKTVAFRFGDRQVQWRLKV